MPITKKQIKFLSELDITCWHGHVDYASIYPLRKGAKCLILLPKVEFSPAYEKMLNGMISVFNLHNEQIVRFRFNSAEVNWGSVLLEVEKLHPENIIYFRNNTDLPSWQVHTVEHPCIIKDNPEAKRLAYQKLLAFKKVLEDDV